MANMQQKKKLNAWSVCEPSEINYSTLCTTTECLLKEEQGVIQFYFKRYARAYSC